ncbi:MAG: serine hydroxymethyltransferase, partial [Pseudomonadota bacterium]
MSVLAPRGWVPEASEAYVQDLAARTAGLDTSAVAEWLQTLTDQNAQIHDRDCINLNPATNVMNPAAERLMAQGLGPRPSLGYPGD